MKCMLAVVGLTGAVFVSGFAYSPGAEKSASESLYGEVMMPGEWMPAVGIVVPFGRSAVVCAKYIKGSDLAVGCYSTWPRLDFVRTWSVSPAEELQADVRASLSRRECGCLTACQCRRFQIWTRCLSTS